MSGVALLAGFVAGFLAGLVHFGGLWWTAKRVSKVKAPASFVAGSFALRMALLLAVLYLVTQGRPGPLAASLAGIWLARKAAVAYVSGAGKASART